MNISQFSLFILLILLTSCSYDQDDNLTATIDINTVEVIRSDSDLFDNIKDITNDEDKPHESIACIDFIYPLTLFIFDDTDTYLSTNFIINDEEFSVLLGDFIFEACELVVDEGISEFILDVYTECIFDTLELDDELPIFYYTTQEDTELETNPILSSEVYNDIESDQSIYIRINDIESDIEYYAIITLSAISC